eukprot:6470765-Amphidinium_carterae.1
MLIGTVIVVYGVFMARVGITVCDLLDMLQEGFITEEFSLHQHAMKVYGKLVSSHAAPIGVTTFALCEDWRSLDDAWLVVRAESAGQFLGHSYCVVFGAVCMISVLAWFLYGLSA